MHIRLTRLTTFVPIGLAVALLASSVPALTATAAAAANPATARLSFQPVLSGLVQPTGVYSSHDGTGRLFILEKTGRIRIYQPGVGLLSRPYLDLRGRISTEGERGLLGLAFYPDFKGIPWVFVSMTVGSQLRVYRYRATSYTANTIPLSSQGLVIAVSHPSTTNHNGGHLVFGTNRLLYIGTGDGGGSGDPFNYAQNLRVLNGKILRIDVSKGCNGNRYCVPRSNPFWGSTRFRSQIWLWGLRNPWQFSVDPGTGNLWIGDVGQNRREEVDVVGQNWKGGSLGWSCMEGRIIYNRSRCISGAKYVQPWVTYGRESGNSITGGFVYRGRAYASLIGGLYIFADFGSGKTWLYQFKGRAVSQGNLLRGVTGFGEDQNREIYAVTIDGRLWRMSARAA